MTLQPSALNVTAPNALGSAHSLHQVEDVAPLFPVSLKKSNRWIVRSADKRPFSPYEKDDHLGPINPHDEQYQSDYKTALEALDLTTRYVGLGFVFNYADGLSGIDFDKCVDPGTRTIRPDIQAILEKIDSYAEFSPSGTGIHIFIQGWQVPCGSGGQQGTKIGNAEMYSGKRYFTVTGDQIPGTPGSVNVRDLGWLYERIVTNREFLKAPTAGSDETKSADYSSCIVERKSTLIAPKFVTLMNGTITRSKDTTGSNPFVIEDDNQSLEYTSQSEADFALLRLIAEKHNTEDPSVLKSEFLKSSLGQRDKATRSDYLDRTILKLLKSIGSSWSELRPIDTLLPAVESFRLEYLPSSLQPWAKDVAERMSVPLDFVGVCALAVLAGVVNRRAFVFPKEHDKEWKEALAVSGAVVASSGKLKTPTWKTFTKVLVEIEYDWRAEFTKRKETYDSQLATWKKEEKCRKKDEPLTGSCDPPQEPSPSRRLMLNDSTPEMMHQIMMDNPEGLFVYRDELASWVAELDKEGREVERGLYLSAMNGNDEYAIDRIGRGSVFATMSASLFGGFQPDLLVEFLSDSRNVSDGMIARFGLLCWPDHTMMPRTDRPADDHAKERFRRIMRTLAELKAESVFLHFASDAQLRFNAWYDAHDRKVHDEPDSGKQSHLSKYRGLLPKLAALLQLADIVDSVPSPAGHHSIDLEHLNRAIRLLGYLESHMNRVYGSIRSPEQKAVESLAGHIRRGDLKDGFSVRDIKRKCWGNLSDAGITQSALMTLVDHGWIRAISADKTSRGGRPTQQWEINPSLEVSSVK